MRASRPTCIRHQAVSAVVVAVAAAAATRASTYTQLDFDTTIRVNGELSYKTYTHLERAYCTHNPSERASERETIYRLSLIHPINFHTQIYIQKKCWSEENLKNPLAIFPHYLRLVVRTRWMCDLCHSPIDVEVEHKYCFASESECFLNAIAGIILWQIDSEFSFSEILYASKQFLLNGQRT